jgi:LPS-assembly lipoprotein
LADASTGKVVVTGSSFSNVSYDTVEQPIADLQAAENARERAAREVAEDIRLRLAAHFSSSN